MSAASFRNISPIRLLNWVLNDVVVLDETHVFLVAKELSSTSGPLVDVRVFIVVALLKDHVCKVHKSSAWLSLDEIAALVAVGGREATVLFRLGHGLAGKRDGFAVAGYLLFHHDLLLNQHVKLHVAVVLASDVESVDSNVAIAGSSHTDRT